MSRGNRSLGWLKKGAQTSRRFTLGRLLCATFFPLPHPVHKKKKPSPTDNTDICLTFFMSINKQTLRSLNRVEVLFVGDQWGDYFGELFPTLMQLVPEINKQKRPPQEFATLSAEVSHYEMALCQREASTAPLSTKLICSHIIKSSSAPPFP